MDGGENKVIGGFRVLKDLKAGAGSQGTVYQAVCETPCFPTLAAGDVVALKVMAVQDDDGEVFARLEKRTAELVALDHPNVVKYHGCFREPGPFNDVHVIVLEFVEGRSLKEMLEAAPRGLGTEDAMRITRGLVDALRYTSSRGIVHRDIKPANIIVRPDGMPKLIDFEVARRTDGTMTTGGSNMIGTFDYMAPDFTESEFRGDVTSDVFSMGICLHEMLTGRTPYRTHSGTSTQANVVFLQRWLKAGSASNPLHVSSRIGKLLVGARDLLERSLAPARDRRIRDFTSFGEALSKVRYRELSHDGHVWRLLRYVGHGGFGEVFAAVDRKTGAPVAIKHLLQADGIERFRREANVLRKISGTCFTRYVDWFTADEGTAFLVMEFLPGMPGSSLKDVFSAHEGRPLARNDVLTAFVRYARGLADLHAHGIVHRDIKPSNLYFPVANPGKAVIMDLGIARDVSATATVGQVPGTIDYMPPECVTGKDRGGPEADVWALGLCLYEALTGKTAYPRLPQGIAAYEEYLKRDMKGMRPDFSGVADQPELLGLLRDMCALKPTKRLRDMRLVERRLRIANGESPATLPPPPDKFVWLEEQEDVALLDAESESGMTIATYCDDSNRSHAGAGRRLRTVGYVALVVLLVFGGIAGWRFAEQRRQAILAETERQLLMTQETAAREEAERRAREEELRAQEEQARRAREEAARQAEIERQREEAEHFRREEERKKIEAERVEKERKAEAERLAHERAEMERKATEERLAHEQAEAKRKADAERIAREQAEAKRKADAERIAREQAEAKRKAEAEKAAKAARTRQAEIARLDAEFKEYDQAYHAKFDEALKPGSLLNPVQLQQEWLVRKKAYKQARKKLEQEK